MCILFLLTRDAFVELIIIIIVSLFRLTNRNHNNSAIAMMFVRPSVRLSICMSFCLSVWDGRAF